MNKRRLPAWVAPVIILLGLGLITTGLVSYFVASETPAGQPTPAPETGANPSPTLTPTTLALASPPATSPPVDTEDVETEEEAPPESAPVNPPSPSPATSSSAGPTFQGDRAYEQVLSQVEIGPRPTGSEAGWATGDFIIAELNAQGWEAESQEFVFKGVRGRNIIGRHPQTEGPIIILGAHYDTRPAADQDPVPLQRDTWIEGANDGASGVAVLLELARTLEPEKLEHRVWLAFFDAEDRGRLEGWPFSVGARHMAQNLAVNPQSVVVVDMVGDADQQFYYERNSDPALSREIWAVAAELGYEAYFIPEPKHTIIDDHLPFVERLIPAIDIIDFDYPYWHTVEDTADKVAPASLERVGRTLEVWLEEKQ